MAKIAKYDESSIKIHKGLEGCRARPNMYIGELGSKGIIHLLHELVENSMDEFIAKRNSFIVVKVMKNDEGGQTFIVGDKGMGIPVGKHKTGVNTLTAIMTILHAGGKFDDKAYSSARGVNGLGVSIVNALSSSCEVWTNRDDEWYYQSFEEGIPIIEKPKYLERQPAVANKLNLDCGTIIRFIPDYGIMSKNTKKSIVKQSDLSEWLYNVAFLNSGIKIKLIFENEESTFYNKEGPEAFVKEILKDIPGEVEKIGKCFVLDTESVTTALQWTDYDGEDKLNTYISGAETLDHGTHLIGLMDGVSRAFKKFSKKASNLTTQDLKIGVVGFLNYRLSQPEFDSQKKDKLITVAAKKDVSEPVFKAVTKWLLVNKSTATTIISRALDLKNARLMAKQLQSAASKIKSKKGKVLLPGKLTQSTTKDPEKRELFIVEGDSAAGSARSARYPEFQEVLAIRGKIINAAKSSLSKTLNSEEVQAILTATGLDLKELKNRTYRVGKILTLCFTGDTLIRLLDGRNVSLKDLYSEVEEKGFVWILGVNEQGKVIPAKATIKKTRKVTKLTRVTLDNGYSVRCTRDHLWLINPTDVKEDRIVWKKGLPYVEAQNLKSGDSLKSSYIGENPHYGGKGYDHILDSNSYTMRHSINPYVMLHHLVYDEVIGKNRDNKLIHHRNENTKDNTPENLKRISRSKHTLLHNENGNSLTDTWNGSKEQEIFLKELWKERKNENSLIYQQYKQRFMDYNKSEQNSKTTSLLNQRQDVIDKQRLGKIGKYYLGLKNAGLEINKENWNSYDCRERRIFWDKDLIQQAKKHIVKMGFSSEDGYKVFKKTEENKRKYPKQVITKFVVFAKRVLKIHGDITRDLYTKLRLKMIRDKKIPQCTPKWETGLKESGLIGKDKKDGLQFIDTFNFSVSKIENITLKKPKSMYCLNVEATGNFGLYAGEKIFSGRKKKFKEENTSYLSTGVVYVKNCDSDEDGKNIEVLLATLFQTIAPDLYEKGMIYVVDAPLYFATYKDKQYSGNTFEEMREKMPKAAPDYLILRMKGWGECSDSILRDLAFNVKTRKILKITPLKNRKERSRFEAVVGENSDMRKELLGVS